MRVGYIKKENIDNKITNKVKLIFNKIRIEKIEENKYIYNILHIKNKKENIKKSSINKIIKQIKNNNIDAVCISNELDKYKENFKDNNIYILEGRWLFKILINNVLEYLSLKMNIKPSNITVLVNEATDINIQIIENITKKVKTLKVVTNNITRFNFLEDKLYNQYGIAITISNNKKKALIKSNIIINLDYTQEELLKYSINRNAIIINIDNQIKQYNKNFSGISINNYNINLNKKQIETFKNYNIYKDFTKSILYESIIIKKDNLSNILKQIAKDNISICNLIGNNGIINDKEYKNIKL